MKLNFKCYFPAEHPFFTQIKAEGSDTVKWLLEEIHKKLVVETYDVELVDLVLYKTYIEMQPTEGRTDRILRWLRTQSKADELEVSEDLGDLFAESQSHKIVVANAEVKEVLDRVDDPGVWSRIRIRKELGKRCSELSSGPSPSAIVKDAKELANFLDAKDHPVCLDHIPAVMFSPPLADLQRNLAKLDHVDVTERDIQHASSFLSATIKSYRDEAERQDAIQRYVNMLMEKDGAWRTRLKWLDNIEPDAMWWEGEGKFPTGILELNNTLGLSGNPFFQCLADYSKIVSASKLADFQGSCNFPVLLLGLSGNRLEVGVAVCGGSIYATRLVAFDITPGFHLSENIIRVARTFKCLSSCRAALEVHYRGINGDRTTTAAIYPNPTSASGDVLPSLTYHGFLSPGGDHISGLPSPDWAIRTTALYRATLQAGEGTAEVVVKFSSRYGEAAHRLLSDAEPAPKLYWCGPIIGGLTMVVMEYLEGSVSLWRNLRDPSTRRPVPDAVFDDVKKALDILHENGLVFGDLRDANVVLSKERGVLVDFDWAGKDGEDRYPAALNAGNQWHSELKALK